MEMSSHLVKYSAHGDDLNELYLLPLNHHTKYCNASRNAQLRCLMSLDHKAVLHPKLDQILLFHSIQKTL